MAEYENLVHSIKPLTLAKEKVIEKLFSHLRHLFPAFLALDVISLNFAEKQADFVKQIILRVKIQTHE